MPAHNMNKILKYGAITFATLLIFAMVSRCSSSHQATPPKTPVVIHNQASGDTEAESLNTLTAQLADAKKQMAEVLKDNEAYRAQLDAQAAMDKKSKGIRPQNADKKAVDQLSQYLVHDDKKSTSPDASQAASTNETQAGGEALGTINDLTAFTPAKKIAINATNNANAQDNKPKIIPFYTIPPNATSVNDKLMTALVGRIPIKGVVTDPYPFKIVISDNTLAANGLRVPHLKQMIVSGYGEGDLGTLSARGWVTSLTFVFQDGTISSVSSNNNNIGHFTKDNSLGFLTDPQGNPFIEGKLISNAAEYLGSSVLLGAATGAATAFSQSQTTNQSSILGGNSSAVTGSAKKYIEGQAMVNATTQAQQWLNDREQQSFDAIYVPPGSDVVVNFSKEIDIDYNPSGRKLVYENTPPSAVAPDLD